MTPSAKRNLQIVMAVALIAATARTAWIFYQRRQSDKAANTSAAPGRTLHADDYVYLRPSHAHDLASARAALKGNTVWVRAGNAVAYYAYTCPTCYNERAGTLPPIAELHVKDVVMARDQMMAVFTFGATAPSADHPPSSVYATPIGVVKNGDASIVIDDIFFLTDPHKLYNHWSKDAWAAIERHEITPGMSEMQAQAAMGVPHTPESGASGEYGNRTLVFTDPAHPDKPVTVRFEENAAVSVVR